jgi:hypothetical protein
MDKWTVDTWKQNYLYGIPDTDPATGLPFPEEAYQHHLDAAYMLLEDKLDHTILAATFTDERHDYHAEEWAAWGFIKTFHRPVRTFTSIQGIFPFYAGDNVQFPLSWVQLDQKSGQINLMAQSGTMAQFIMEAGGALLPELFRFQSYVPRFFSLAYDAGYDDGLIPIDLNQAVAKLAAMSALNILGDLIGGVGVLGSSVGMDGLSQFISMTKTATTGAFFSRVLQYRTERRSPDAPCGTARYCARSRQFRISGDRRERSERRRRAILRDYRLARGTHGALFTMKPSVSV